MAFFDDDNMMQYAGLLASLPTFSGRRNPVNPLAPYFLQAGARKRQEEKEKLQLEALKQQAAQAQTQRQAQNEAAFMLSPESRRAPSASANFTPQEYAQTLLSKGIKADNPIVTKHAQGLLAPKEDTYRTVGPGQTLFKNDTPVFTGQSVQPKNPTSVQEYNFAKSQGYKGGYTDFINSKKSSTNINVNLPGENKQPLTNTTKTTAQKDLVVLNDSIARFEALKSLYKPEYLTNQGKLTAWGLKQADKWGIKPETFGKDSKDFLSGITTHKQAVEQEFNQYRKEITGAAAALAELDRLMATFLNTDLSPTQYEASYDQLLSKMKRARDIKQKLLREGLEVGSPEFTKRHNQLYMGAAKNSFSGVSNDDFMKMRPK